MGTALGWPEGRSVKALGSAVVELYEVARSSARCQVARLEDGRWTFRAGLLGWGAWRSVKVALDPDLLARLGYERIEGTGGAG